MLSKKDTSFGRMNNFELCKGVCKLHGSIIGAKIIEKAKLVAMYNRPGTPIPSEKEFDKLFFQTEVIASITKTHVESFGQPKFFTISFENSDLYFFLLSRYSRSGILIIQLANKPYDHKEIVASVDAYLGHVL